MRKVIMLECVPVTCKSFLSEEHLVYLGYGHQMLDVVEQWWEKMTYSCHLPAVCLHNIYSTAVSSKGVKACIYLCVRVCFSFAQSLKTWFSMCIGYFLYLRKYLGTLSTSVIFLQDRCED